MKCLIFIIEYLIEIFEISNEIFEIGGKGCECANVQKKLQNSRKISFCFYMQYEGTFISENACFRNDKNCTNPRR